MAPFTKVDMHLIYPHATSTLGLTAEGASLAVDRDSQHNRGIRLDGDVLVRLLPAKTC